jgi:hypothetical protein
MRLHPNRRASTDHAPGPNIARAAPEAAIRRYSKLCPCAMNIPPTSINATSVPTITVYKPTTRKIAELPRRTDMMAMGMEGPLSRAGMEMRINAKPMTRRINIRPNPGQPPAKVEYKRRNGRTSPTAIFLVLARNWRPRSGLDSASFEAAVRLVGLYSSMIPRFRAMVVAWVRSLAPNLERMFFTRLFTDSSVVES